MAGAGTRTYRVTDAPPDPYEGASGRSRALSATLTQNCALTRIVRQTETEPYGDEDALHA